MREAISNPWASVKLGVYEVLLSHLFKGLSKKVLLLSPRTDAAMVRAVHIADPG